MQRSGGDFDEKLVLRRDGIGKGGVAGRAIEGFDDGGIHGEAPSRDKITDARDPT